MTSPVRTRSVARRVTLLALALVAVALVAVSIAISLITTKAARAQIAEGVRDAVDAVGQSLNAVDEANREPGAPIGPGVPARL